MEVASLMQGGERKLRKDERFCLSTLRGNLCTCSSASIMAMESMNQAGAKSATPRAVPASRFSGLVSLRSFFRTVNPGELPLSIRLMSGVLSMNALWGYG